MILAKVREGVKQVYSVVVDSEISFGEVPIQLIPLGQKMPIGREIGWLDATLERLAHHNFSIANKKLRGTLLRAADNRDEAVDLAARDQAQHTAGWAGQHGPVGIFLLADFAGVFQDKDGSGLHLFRDPFIDHIQFADHVSPL
jgi:hypothetical protein